MLRVNGRSVFARLIIGACARRMRSPPREEVVSMCHEEYFRRRRREADESWAMWEDFERTWPVADPGRPSDVPEPERAEPEEEISVAER
jgi:hypothetical protein